MKLTLMLALACAGAALTAPVRARAAEPELSGLAEQLARLRSDLEGLDARLAEQREDRRSQLRALAAQKSAVELELQREELRSQQLQSRLDRTQDRQRTVDTRRAHLVGAISPALTALAAGVRSGPPFHVEERAAPLDALGRELAAGTISASDALGKLWTWVDAEVALARTTGVLPQVVTLGGAEVMADVAHLGLVSLYARTADGRLAVARANGSAWSWDLITVPAEQEQVRALYAALEKDVDKGFFVLPRPLSVIAQAGERR